MICVDTTFLVDLWRNSGRPEAGCVQLLNDRSGEVFAVPAHAAGEFLEGGASISKKRFNESLTFLRLFAVKQVGIETAEHYAHAVAALRAKRRLAGMSKPDLWIAASALEHGCPLVTRNLKHFEALEHLELLPY